MSATSSNPNTRPWAWLILGLVLTPLSAYRWGVPALAWGAPVPWMIYAASTAGGRARALLLGAMGLACTLQVAKIVTPPLSYALAPAFALPAALSGWGVVLLWDAARRRAGPVAAIAAAAALAACSDVGTYAGSALGAWGTMVSTQVQVPLVLQWTAWGGSGLLGLLSGAVAATAAGLILGDPVRRVAAALAVGGVTLGVAGAARLEGPAPGAPLRVGLVSTALGLGPEGMPPTDVRLAEQDALFARTAEAADQGARLVAWNEAAAFLLPEEEAGFLARAAAAAVAHQIDLIVAYGILESADPMLYRNEASWLSPEGQRLQTYAKHHPVPGEPAVRGTAPLALVERPWGRAGIAICYDYDFPAISREYARLGADLVVVPASDWAGIDPQHPWMAAVRAIESGVPIVRPVRWASSAVFDARGRSRGWKRPDEGLLLVADVPVGRLPTLYTQVGDGPVLALAGLLLMGVVGAGARARRVDRPTS